MSPSIPLVVATLQSDEKDVAYQLYREAYGLEMQIDNEWKVEVILLVPFEHLNTIIGDTDITGEDVAIVSAGVTDIPLPGNGVLNSTLFSDPRNNWVLLGDPLHLESPEQFLEKRDFALKQNCRLILCLTELTEEHLYFRLQGLKDLDCSRLVIALLPPEALETQFSKKSKIYSRLSSFFSTNPSFEKLRVLVAGKFLGEEVNSVITNTQANGVFLRDSSCNDYGNILKVLKCLGGGH